MPTSLEIILDDLRHIDVEPKEMKCYQAALWEGWSAILPTHADDLSDGRASNTEIMKTIQYMTEMLSHPILAATLVGTK